MQPLPDKKPKSVGVKIKGSCGHSYTHRIDLQDISYLESTAYDTEKNKAIEKVSRILSARDCNNCMGKQEIESIKTANDGIMDALGLARLSPIETGSYGQKAWAERVRSSHLQHIILLSISLVGGMSTAEYMIFGSQYKDRTYPDTIKQSLDKFRDIKTHISEVGYLGYVFTSDLDGPDSTLLRRLLLVRYLIKENLLFFKEHRHTAWIMHDKTGKNPYNTRFKHVPPTLYFSIMVALAEEFDSVEEYESLIEALSERARPEIKEVVGSLDPTMSPAEKMDLVRVYLSLRGKDMEPPF